MGGSSSKSYNVPRAARPILSQLGEYGTDMAENFQNARGGQLQQKAQQQLLLTARGHFVNPLANAPLQQVNREQQRVAMDTLGKALALTRNRAARAGSLDSSTQAKIEAEQSRRTAEDVAGATAANNLNTMARERSLQMQSLPLAMEADDMPYKKTLELLRAMTGTAGSQSRDASGLEYLSAIGSLI